MVNEWKWNLKDKRVVVVGCGSGGGTVGDMLVRAGFRKFTLVDPDKLEPKNLSRHVLTDAFVGWNKAEAMMFHIKNINPGAEVIPIGGKFDDLPTKPDVIACCADSDLCCQLVNDYSLREGVPVVYGAVWGAAETAEIITVIPGVTPCYACYEREGPEPEPSQEKYTNPDYDSTKMPHQEGLWCDVLMAASIQFRAILKVLQVEERIAEANKSRKERGIIYGCFGELWADVVPLVLMSLRPPFKYESFNQKERCAICSDDYSGLTV